MHVTNVWVNKWSSGKQVGWATFRFALTPEGDGCLTVKDFKIFKGSDGGLFVGMPSKKMPDGEWKPTFDIYTKNEDGQSLLNEMNQKVAVAFDNTEDRQPRQNYQQQSSQQTSQPAGTGGLPF